VDLPATQRAKESATRSLGLRSVRYVPADLRQTRLSVALGRAPGFSPARDTVFAAEGVLMYLPPHVVDDVLDDLSDDRRKTRAILTCVTPDAQGKPRMHSQRTVVDYCMRLLGEPFVWGERDERLRERVERHAFHVDSLLFNRTMNDAQFRALGRPAPP